MVIMGIDPGIASCGYGIIAIKPDKSELLECGCIRTNSKQDRGERLRIIYEKIDRLIKDFSPDCISMEKVFFYKGIGRNFSTALNVGEAVGVIRLCASQHNIPINEYAPTQVKEVIVGYGRADKKQVQLMVKEILNTEEIISTRHAADALACALTHRTNLEFGEE
ncbi:MAG: crossover junction endodeoxyribonuclease RuvC [Candidatus Eremiobacteraeota bacterium]|nr:crossover junction endodeoxyribonuclease RuvC [Candidatus Eremiobacteraeota bacterium]